VKQSHKSIFLAAKILVCTLTALVINGCSTGSTPASTSIPATPIGQAITLDMESTGEIISGTTKVSAQASPKDEKSLPCPKLDSQLNQVLASEDPLATAKQSKLNIKEKKIQVVIVLKDQDTAFLQDYEVEIGSQSGSEFQVFAALTQLCKLSNRDEILAIRLPSAGVAP
jgi:hypothetical protein